MLTAVEQGERDRRRVMEEAVLDDLISYFLRTYKPLGRDRRNTEFEVDVHRLVRAAAEVGSLPYRRHMEAMVASMPSLWSVATKIVP